MTGVVRLLSQHASELVGEGGPKSAANADLGLHFINGYGYIAASKG